jgi:hypothetical protein
MCGRGRVSVFNRKKLEEKFFNKKKKKKTKKKKKELLGFIIFFYLRLSLFDSNVVDYEGWCDINNGAFQVD